MVKNTANLRKHGTLFQSDTHNTDSLISPAYNLLNSKTAIPNVSVKGEAENVYFGHNYVKKNMFRFL